tara:strand:+ start:42 stop:536 length:495 start_codon:yes stop_codon:yes gene_type:complete
MGDLMSTPESIKKTLETKEKAKIGKGGLRGTPRLDDVNNKSIMVNDGKGSREGHTRIDGDTLKGLDRAAKELKIGRSELIRKVCRSFCMYFTESKMLGGNPFFNTPKTYEMWLHDRTQVRELLNDITKMNKEMQVNSQSMEVKMMSKQIVALANMMNLTHKTVL